MDIKIVDPIEYPDWDSLLLRVNDYSFFHSSAWAKVLKESYQYKPIYFSFFENGNLAFLMPLMEIRSQLTGKRGVSLPFTDQCAPYFLKREVLQDAVQRAIDYGVRARWRYIEWRGTEYFTEGVIPSEVYYTHDLNLMRTEAELFSIIRESNRRNVKKSIREGVYIKIDQSLEALKSFYRLNCMTRKRHGLPPQPFAFFRNVFNHIISKGYGIVVSAFHSEKLIAASVFFHFGRGAIFKYGASDNKHHNLRPNNLILWEAIKWYRNRGFESLNLGRTELENLGLLQYKRIWGATESSIKYYRYDFKQKSFLKNRPRINDFYVKLFARTPAGILRYFGRLVYKHVG